MKHNRIIMAILAVMFLAGCENPDTPNYNSGKSSNGNEDVSVNFSYKVTQPFTYEFENLSTGVSSYKWDFGDGNTANTINAKHTYASIGTYTVTLTGIKNGTKYDCRKKVTVKKPSIYIAGYTLYSIPFENKYYKVKCEDDDWFETNWGFTTNYTPLLDNSDIPYTRLFNSPLLMDKLDGDNYYTFYVYYSSNTTASGTQCLKQKLNKTEILKYKEEHILTSDNGKTKLGIIMQYK